MEAIGSTGPPGGRSAAPRSPAAPSARRLRLAPDERLVGRVRGGSHEAFAVLWERYQLPLLSYCRHLLGSHHEAEEAVQQAFANAYRAMARAERRELRVRPWLYRIARNQCFSLLRSRKPADLLREEEPSLVGLSDELADRAELRATLRDLAGLPTDQREALVLAELHDNSHAQVAEILGCEPNKVKALVFQARASLIKSRTARELPCDEVQAQLSVMRGGSLRRAVLRRHLAHCEACALFAAEVKRQRAALAVVLPVVPTGALKLGAATAFAATATTTATTASSATGAGIAAKLGVSGSLLKSAAATLAVTTAAAGGVATSAQVAKDVTHDARAPITQPAAAPSSAAPPATAPAAAPRAAADLLGTGQAPTARRPGRAGEELPADRRPGPGKSRPRLGSRQPAARAPERPHRGKRPAEGKRPPRPVSTREPGAGPVRERPRPRPGAKPRPLRPTPPAKQRPARPAEPPAPARDGTAAVP